MRISEEEALTKGLMNNATVEEGRIFERGSDLIKEIKRLKIEKNAIILAHYYQDDEVKIVADFIGDSLQLSKNAREANCDIIVFAGVIFMAETAKILNPQTKVVIPSMEAKCSLADSILVENLRKLKMLNPDAAVVSYVNTYANIKAESDICCTSANYQKVIESLPHKKIIFIPDEYMALNLKTNKQIIPWKGRCIVHEQFTPEQIKAYKKIRELEILVHIECSPQVASSANYAGSTSGIRKYILNSKVKNFLILTECGMIGDLKREFPDKNFYTPCTICPYMKKITLEGVYFSLRDEIYEICIPEDIRQKAYLALDRMLQLS